MNNRLLFRRLLDPAQRDIVFGRPVGPALDAEGRLTIALPAAAPVTFVGLLRYDNAVLRSDVISTACAWQAADPVSPAQLAAPQAPATPVPAVQGLPWQTARHASCATSAPWRSTAPLRTSVRAPWSPAVPLPLRSIAGGWQPADLLRGSLAGRWQLAARVSTRTSAPWQTANIIRTPAQRLPWGAGLPLRVTLRASAGPAETVGVVVASLPWGWGETLPPGRTVIIVTPPPEPWRCYMPPAGGAAHLLFDKRRSAGTDIVFTCGQGSSAGPLVIPTLRAYIVINSATLTRVSNNLQLPLRDISISGDADSVHWSWSATLPLRALADIEPDAPGQLVELEARLNDMPWRLLVEKRTESERFGSASLRVSGRGIAAELSAPGAGASPRSNFASAQTAQQLAAGALTINGVSNGWTLTWQGADWLLPAGLWAHTGTPIEAVLRLAEAAGAYVLPAPAARSLAVIPRYPAAPWEWSGLAPGVVLPAAATLERGSDEIVRPGYNIVYVCGQDLNARVRRAGSAGDRPAQMIVDQLTAHADAARQRGLAALAEASSHRMEHLETGILPGYGVIQIGTVLDWVRGQTTRRGIVRELAVAASLPSGSSKDPVKVRQTLGAEIHE